MTKYNRQPVVCQHCDTVFMAKPSAINNPDPARHPKYCSKQCQARAGYARKLANVVHKPNQGSFKPGHRKGKNNAMYVEPIPFVCENCQSTFTLKPWVIRQGNKGRFCSTKCRGEYRAKFESGPNSPWWVGGPKTYRGRNWLQVRAIVVAEQEGKCAKCDKLVGESLPIHHRIPYREFATSEEANVRSNLIGLCQSCHLRIEYGTMSL